MPGIARNSGTDVAGGAIVQGSSNVFIEGKPAVRVGDLVGGHGRGPHSAPVMAQGSGNVLVNGIGVGRSGDIATCGHPVSGSGTVFAN
jgi:hypothetical protein